jgi:uncharacterized protein YjbI with pentapeptide repeats
MNSQTYNGHGAFLEGANLRAANVRAANLVGASLDEVELAVASIVRAFPKGANLDGADLPFQQ